jgi:hypothetical protein
MVGPFVTTLNPRHHDAAHKVFLQHDEKNQNGDDAQKCSSHQVLIERRVLLAKG